MSILLLLAALACFLGTAYWFYILFDRATDPDQPPLLILPALAVLMVGCLATVILVAAAGAA